jgi:hypothetical protein
MPHAAVHKEEGTGMSDGASMRRGDGLVALILNCLENTREHKGRIVRRPFYLTSIQAKEIGYRLVDEAKKARESGLRERGCLP